MNLPFTTELKCKVDKNSKTKHSLFMRQHIVREKNPKKPSEKTLFVAGVPPFFTQSTIRELLGQFGEISSIYIHKSPTPKCPIEELSTFFKIQEPIVGYKVAYVVYKNSKSLENALKKQKVMLLAKETLFNGFEKWAEEYNHRIPDPDSLNREIEDFMSTFDDEQVKKQEEEKLATNEDDDGWITVNKKGRNPGFSRKQSVTDQLQKMEDRRRKKKEHTNFYRFQIKESKMKNLVALRQKFEEDKKKIAALKATRRFKPF